MVVVIDEVEQVLWHLLNGGTCRENRVKLLTNFKKLLQRAALSQEGKIFIADADLCSISINYIEQLIGYKVPKFIVKNDYVPDLKRLLFHLKEKNPSGLLKQLENNLKQGHKVIVHTDGQTYASKWGTLNLEAYLRNKFPDKNILRVDGKSVKDKTHPALGCIDKLNEVFPKFDIVICSPVIETGVSINCDHFDSVYVLSHGVQTIDAVVQTLQRVRSNVPRYLWTKSFSPNQIGNGATDIKHFLSSTHKLASTQIKLLQSMGITEANNVVFYEENDDLKTCAPSLLAWAKRAVVINHQNYHFSKNLIKNLEGLGYELQEKRIEKEEMEAVSESMKEIKKENYGNYKDRVSSSPDLEDKTYQEWKERDDLTEAEEETLKKAEISRCYLTDEVNPSMVEKHDQGWLTKLQLLYYSTVGNQYLKA